MQRNISSKGQVYTIFQEDIGGLQEVIADSMESAILSYVSKTIEATSLTIHCKDSFPYQGNPNKKAYFLMISFLDSKQLPFVVVLDE